VGGWRRPSRVREDGRLKQNKSENMGEGWAEAASKVEENIVVHGSPGGGTVGLGLNLVLVCVIKPWCLGSYNR
jgi:hypothetical protein